MTRKEEIGKAAKQKYPYEGGTKGLICENSIPIFIQGAEWADQTMLDRACEWMNKVFFQNPFLTKKGIVSGKYDTMEEFITAFKQAMKGE